MKQVALRETTLESCVSEAQRERVVVTSKGKPLALIVGVKGLDQEQLELGSSHKFWEMIIKRRSHKTITRARLEQKLREKR